MPKALSDPGSGKYRILPDLLPLCIPIDSVEFDPVNARDHSQRNLASIEHSLSTYGQHRPLVVQLHDGRRIVRVGNGTLAAARNLGWTHIAAIVHEEADVEAIGRALADNRTGELAEWNQANLAQLEQVVGSQALQAIGWTEHELEEMRKSAAAAILGAGDKRSPEEKEAAASLSAKTLAERFLVPPFSVLDAQAGYWRQRKAAWVELGIRSESGRAANLLKFSDTLLEPDPDKRAALAQTAEEGEPVAPAAEGGTSIFDPVLCELAYRWFSPRAGRVLDPFAGGSVRGIVAGRLGRAYTGIELRQEQVEENRAQAREIFPKPEAHPEAGESSTAKKPTRRQVAARALAEEKRAQEAAREQGFELPQWIHGDSLDISKLTRAPFDFLFSCPPYFDLERYSEDPRDISNADDYEKFLLSYRTIIRLACFQLADNRFAAFVVGDIRSSDGLYRGFVADTIDAFAAAGLSLYNEAILVSPVGSLPIRAGRTFAASRKLGKTHQNLLVFVKGDWRLACESLGDLSEEDFGLDPIAGSAREKDQAQAELAADSDRSEIEKQFGKPLTAANLAENGGEIE